MAVALLERVRDAGAEAAWCSARSEHRERFTSWGAELVGPYQVEGSQAPQGTEHLLMVYPVTALQALEG